MSIKPLKDSKFKVYLITLALSAQILFAQDIQYSLVEIGSGLQGPIATDINNLGQAVGYGGLNGFQNAFIWENGNITIISDDALGVAINDAGWVLYVSFILDNFDSLYLWKNGATINLNPFPLGAEITGGDEYFFFDVNNENNVIANFTFDEGDTYVAHVWQNGAWSALGKPNGFDSHVATKINDNNDISGYYFDSNEGIERPLYWQNKLPLSFSFEGYTSSLTNDLRLVGGYNIFDFTLGGWFWNNGPLDSIMSESIPTDINENGTVLGFRHLYKDGSTYSIESLLDTSGNEYVSFNLNAINDFDQIVGYAFKNNDNRAIVLNPILLQLQITSPQADEKWIAGEQGTIKWISNPLDTVEIEMSIDGGNNYETLESFFPASAGEYVWTIPDTVLSTKCKIRITNEFLPGIFAESDLFKIKDYHLTRMTPSGDYEKFVPNQDGWQFGNNSNSMWPMTWWQQFFYDGIDPVSNQPYQTEFGDLPASKFPDWPLWVETFGTGQCYWNVNTGVYKSKSVKRWKSLSGTWAGSCYGFAISGLIGFNFKTELLTQNPALPNYNNLFELGVNNNIRKVVNLYFTHQFRKLHYQNKKAKYNNSPRTTLNDLKQNLLTDDGNIGRLAIYNQSGSGGHAVSPYKLEKNKTVPGRYRIYVYDSRSPGSDTSFIVIDSTLNVWVDSTGLGWSGLKGLFVGPPASNYLSQPILPAIDKAIRSFNGETSVEIYTNYTSDYLITTLAGDSVGFVEDSLIINLDESIPIIPEVGGLHPPLGYYLPEGEYFISMNNFSDSTAYLTVFGDITYDYQRSDATGNQVDKFYYNGNFSVSSDDVEIKNIELSTVIERDSTEKTIYLENTTIKQNDSLDLSIQDYDKLTFKNYGTEKNYDLRSIYAEPGGGAFFLYEEINLAANTSHQIAPVWEDLVNTPIKILIDIGIDGSIDDSLEISNQITNVKDQGTLYIPRKYKLEQNYPNPFNPTTTIQYSIPSPSFVSLKVYDVLGKEVATLVNEEKPIGNFEVKFDAGVLSSGIYFYKIEAGSFIATQKMLLIK